MMCGFATKRDDENGFQRTLTLSLTPAKKRFEVSQNEAFCLIANKVVLKLDSGSIILTSSQTTAVAVVTR
jgi:hypothetical protein